MRASGIPGLLVWSIQSWLWSEVGCNYPDALLIGNKKPPMKGVVSQTRANLDYHVNRIIGPI